MQANMFGPRRGKLGGGDWAALKFFKDKEKMKFPSCEGIFRHRPSH